VWSDALLFFLRRGANRVVKGAWSCHNCCPFFAFLYPSSAKNGLLRRGKVGVECGRYRVGVFVFYFYS